MRAIKLLLLTATLWLCSCTTITTKQPIGSIALGDNSYLTLSTTPTSMVGQGFLTQVTGKHGHNDYELLVQVELSQDNIVMVGTTANGMMLFQLQWQPDKPYTLEHSPLAGDIDVQYLLADFQLVHWPISELQQHLYGATFIDDEQQRKFVDKQQQPLINIDYHINSDQNKQIRYNNLQRQYSFTLTILEKWNL